MQFLPILTFNGQAVGDVPLLGEGSAGDVHQDKVKQVWTLIIRQKKCAPEKSAAGFKAIVHSI